MALRKKTLRKMTPKARKIGKLLGELESVATRLKNMLPEIQDMEMWQSAEKKRREFYRKEKDIE